VIGMARSEYLCKGNVGGMHVDVYLDTAFCVPFFLDGSHRVDINSENIGHFDEKTQKALKERFY